MRLNLNLRKTGRILCVDASLCNTGVAVFCRRRGRFIHAEVIRTEKSHASYSSVDSARRCQVLALQLSYLSQAYRAKVMLAELPHGGGQSATAIKAMALSQAVVACVCALGGIELHVLQPSQLKHLVLKKGKVDKQAIQDYVSAIHGTSLWPKTALREHVADAMMCLEAAKADKFICRELGL